MSTYEGSKGLLMLEAMDPEDGTGLGYSEFVDKGKALGMFTTLELLEELRMRGDLAMVAMPTTSRGADGSVLSAMAGSQLRSLETETLEAVRGA